MSRLCRLKTSSHGEDGKWAYEEITRLRQQVSALTEQRDAAMEALVLAKVQGAKTDRDAIIDNALDYINAIQPAEVKG